MQLGSDSAPAVVITPGAGVAQMGAPLEMPADGRVFAIGTYIRSLAGFGGLDYRLVLWGWGGAVDSPNRILGQTALHTVGAAGSTPANLLRVAWPLESPVELKQFNDVLVGVAWETDPARQALLGGTSGTGLRYRKDLAAGAAWPVTMTNAIPLTDHDYVAWIDDYEPLSGVWVMRNGDWRQADDVMVRRAGFWEPAAGVKVRRSGVWTDAS